MIPLLLGALSLLALVQGSPVVSKLTAQVKPAKEVNGTVEYGTACKTCPYNLCTNVFNAGNGENVTLTCWATGDTIGDTDLWLRIESGCYLSEFDLVEYEGDFSKDLHTCGKIPMTITKQPAQVRYLSECKWRPFTSGESMSHYGRDQDITLTCWIPGGDVMNNPYWYKTTDNCHVSGSGLWRTPNHDKLDNCGPEPGARINGTAIALKDKHDSGLAPAVIKKRGDKRKASAMFPRWLQPEEIGEEYSFCRSCANSTTTPSCKLVKVYEYNQTVVSQCRQTIEFTYPNGSFATSRYMLTTDWCWVDGNDFWVPPWDYYRYPSCSSWGVS